MTRIINEKESKGNGEDRNEKEHSIQININTYNNLEKIEKTQDEEVKDYPLSKTIEKVHQEEATHISTGTSFVT